MLKHTTHIRVRYADTDQMNFVYNGKYFEYFEVGRTEMMRDLNMPYRKIEEAGFQMPVIEAHINYKNPAFYDEALEIETKVDSLPELRVITNYTIRSIERNVIICDGYIVLVFRNKATGRISRPPDFFINSIKKYFDENEAQ